MNSPKSVKKITKPVTENIMSEGRSYNIPRETNFNIKSSNKEKTNIPTMSDSLDKQRTSRTSNRQKINQKLREPSPEPEFILEPDTRTIPIRHSIYGLNSYLSNGFLDYDIVQKKGFIYEFENYYNKWTKINNIIILHDEEDDLNNIDCLKSFITMLVKEPINIDKTINTAVFEQLPQEDLEQLIDLILDDCMFLEDLKNEDVNETETEL